MPKELMPDECPFCGVQPQFGLTKKTGCQMHGDPMQRMTLGCKNQKCDAKPMVTGGDIYANGETGRFLEIGKAEARELTISRWNTRANPAPREVTGAVDDDALTIAYMKGVEEGKSRRSEATVLELHKLILSRIYSMNTCSENALQAAETLIEHYTITRK